MSCHAHANMPQKSILSIFDVYLDLLFSLNSPCSAGTRDHEIYDIPLIISYHNLLYLSLVLLLDWSLLLPFTFVTIITLAIWYSAVLSFMTAQSQPIHCWFWPCALQHRFVAFRSCHFHPTYCGNHNSLSHLLAPLTSLSALLWK